MTTLVAQTGSSFAGHRLLVFSLPPLAVVCGVLSVVLPALGPTFVLALLFAAVTLHSLAAGVTFFTVLIFFEQVPGVPNVALNGMRLVSGAILVFAALRRSGTPLLARDRPVFAYAIAFFAIWTAASTLWAREVGVAAVTAVVVALDVVLVYIVFASVREARHVRWIIWAYVAGGVASVLAGLVTTSPEAADSVEASRLSGGIADPNLLAAFLIPALALAAFALAGAESSAERWLLACAIVVFAVALFATESRGGLIGLIAAFVAAILVAGRLRPHAIALVFLVCAAGVGYYGLIAPQSSLERITNFTSDRGAGRVDIWSVAGSVAADHPLVGVGAGNFREVEPSYAAETINLPAVEHILDEPKVVHNTYLELLAELGVVGFVSFVSVVVGLFVLAVQGLREFVRRGDIQLELLTRGLIVGMAGMLASFVFISGHTQKHFWLLAGLTAAVASTLVRRGASDASSRVSELG